MQNMTDMLHDTSSHVAGAVDLRSDGGDVRNNCWQSSWLPGDKLAVGFRSAELQQLHCGDTTLCKTFPLSHL